MRSPVTYYGGKTGMAKAIVAPMPAHRCYLEPFFGSGAVLFAKSRCTHEIVNDIDSAVVTFFRVLRDRLPELEAACALTPYARDEWRLADCDEPGLDDIEKARRWWTRVNQSFAKTAGHRTGWSISTARTQAPPWSTIGRLGRFEAAAERLTGVTIDNRDAATLIDSAATADTVIYADPPYLQSTRRSDRTAEYSDYRHELDDDGHERLAEVLNRTPAKVILSGYPSPVYDSLYAGWATVDRAVTVASSNAATVTRGSRTERLWLNFDPPNQLEFDMPPIHLVREAGDNRSICGIKNPNPVMVDRARPNLSPNFTVCPNCKAAA
jgi:DNA adenine methylase